MSKLKLGFLKREFFAGDRTGTTIKGYELAIINTGGKLKVGKVIDVEKLKEAEFVDTLCFQTEIGLEEKTVDLEQILREDKEGKKWLDGVQRYFSEYFEESVPMTFSMKPLQFPKDMEYKAMPKDYLEKEYWYKCPGAVIRELPKTLVYWDVMPLMKFSDGTWIRGVYYCRNVKGPKNIFDSYLNRDPSDENPMRSAKGVLLGSLCAENLEEITGDFEGDFPLEHFLDCTYAIPLSLVNKYNPSTIRVELTKENI